MSVRLFDLRLFGAEKNTTVFLSIAKCWTVGNATDRSNPGRLRYRRVFHRAAKASLTRAERPASAVTGVTAAPVHPVGTNRRGGTTRHTAGTWCAAIASGIPGSARGSRRCSRDGPQSHCQRSSFAGRQRHCGQRMRTSKSPMIWRTSLLVCTRAKNTDTFQRMGRAARRSRWSSGSDRLRLDQAPAARIFDRERLDLVVHHARADRRAAPRRPSAPSSTSSAPRPAPGARSPRAGCRSAGS